MSMRDIVRLRWTQHTVHQRTLWTWTYQSFETQSYRL